MEKELKKLKDEQTGWRKNAIAFTDRYINEGLRDRALTRDLDWGIAVPKEGYENKTIYIWAENVLGYLSASKLAADERNNGFYDLWGENSRHYYVHGKDNIPFHTIILPSLLIASGEKYHLPDRIISSEYLTLEGQKISTSRSYAIWVKDLLKSYEPDSIRYFFLKNGPEKKDADFSWREYVYSHNGELLGAYGNFVNRSLSFINKYWNGCIPEGRNNSETEERLDKLFADTGGLIEKGAFKEAIGGIFDYVREANKFFDTQKAWVTISTDEGACKNTLYECVQIIANLAVLLYPFLPFSSEKVCRWLGIDNKWERKSVPAGHKLSGVEILFQRIDKKAIEEETEKLRKLL